VAGLMEERKKLEKEISDLRKKIAAGGGASAEAAPAAKTVAGITFSGRVLNDVPAKDLKGVADTIKKQIGSGVVALVSVSEGKASLVVGVTDDLTGRISAVDLVKSGAAAVGGKGGGGRADMAQAGGPDGGNAPEVLAAIERDLAALA